MMAPSVAAAFLHNAAELQVWQTRRCAPRQWPQQRREACHDSQTKFTCQMHPRNKRWWLLPSVCGAQRGQARIVDLGFPILFRKIRKEARESVKLRRIPLLLKDSPEPLILHSKTIPIILKEGSANNRFQVLISYARGL